LEIQSLCNNLQRRKINEMDKNDKIKNKKKRNKYIIFGVIGLIVLLVVLKKTGVMGGPETTKVITEFVTKRTITEVVSANGKVQPEVEVKISPDVSGEVVELCVKEGDQVKKGDLLAKINPDIYASNLNRVSATVSSSKASLANAKARQSQVEAQFINAQATYDRNVKLWEQKAISASEYDAAKSAYEVAKAEVDAAKETVNGGVFGVYSSQASLKEAQDNLTKTSIFAPVDGTVSKLNVEKGERVVGTSQFAGTEIMRIADLNEMEVNVSVNENDIVRVHLGDTALVEVDAYLNRKFKGIVTEIANSANTSGTSVDQVTNFDVKIRILRESYKDLLTDKDPNQSPFRPGMSATVDIQTKTVVNVLSVPIQSVTAREDSTKKKEVKKKEDNGKGGGSGPGGPPDEQVEKDVKSKAADIVEFVFIYENGKVRKQIVKTGIQDNTNIQIISGLSEKQEVVSGPYSAITKKLKDGDKVKKVDKKDLYNEKDTK